MGAPAGNQFWKIRAKHGRDKLFETPELLLESAFEYFEWCENNPLIEIVHDKLKENGVGDKLTMVELPKMRPFTLGGLCIYLGCSTEYFRHFEDNNKDSKDFMPIIAHIKEIIYTQKFTGAATGFFNANIISRDLGLSDKTEHSGSVNTTPNNIQITLPNGKQIDDFDIS